MPESFNHLLRIVLAAALVPGIVDAQRSGASRAATAVRVETIPHVVGLSIKVATDSLARTGLAIVELPLTTDTVAAGTVVGQRPPSGTAVTRTKAETLTVARARRVLPGTRRPLPASTTIAPPARSPGDAGRPPTSVTVDIATNPGAAPVNVPGVVVQARTPVPDLYKHSAQDVDASLERSRLRMGKSTLAHDDAIPPGFVFKQHPPAGDSVTTWSTVDVWFSLGRHPNVDSVTVPPVVGLDLRRATDSLRRVGLARGHVDTAVVAKATGAVADQSPAAGTQRHRGDAVDLKVAIAPKSVRVPDVIGMPRDSAEVRLAAAGLGVGVVTLVAEGDRGQGIIKQSPAENSRADSGSLVDIVENRPPEQRTVIVPDVIGMSSVGARRQLELDSLFLGDVLRPGTTSLDEVVEQYPLAGSTAYMHTAVSVTLGSRAPSDSLVEVPDVVTLPIDSARRVLLDRGFSRFSITGRRDSVTSASVVASQDPASGQFANPAILVSMVAVAPPPAVLVPKVVDLHPDDALAATTVRGLRLVIVDRVRAFRLTSAVVAQAPAADSPAAANSAVSVAVAIPMVPPIPAAVFGLTVVAGVAAYTRRRKGLELKEKKEPERPKSGAIDLETRVSSRLTPGTVSQDGLIKASLTLRVEVKESSQDAHKPYESLIKSWRPRDGRE